MSKRNLLRGFHGAGKKLQNSRDFPAIPGMNLPSDITVKTSKGSKEVSMTDTEMFVSCFSVQTENNQSEEPL